MVRWLRIAYSWVRDLDDRTSIDPWGRLIGTFAIFSGFVNAIRWVPPLGDILADAINSWLFSVLSILYILAGLALLWGMAARRRDWTAFGVILIAALTGMRLLSILLLIGWTRLVATNIVYDVLVLWTCRTAYRNLKRGHMVIVEDRKHDT